MKKDTRNLLLVVGAGAAIYFFVIAPGQKTKKLTVIAYDGTQHDIDVEQGISTAAVAKIQLFFGTQGMPLSLNPAGDEATLIADLKSQGYSKAAASVDALYKQLLSGAQLASGYAAGALFNHPNVYGIPHVPGGAFRAEGRAFGRDAGAITGTGWTPPRYAYAAPRAMITRQSLAHSAHRGMQHHGPQRMQG